MKVQELIDLLNAHTMLISDPAIFDKDYKAVFATDLMSDALAMINDSQENTLLLTGLMNPQAIRTAEMLDISLIIFVRGKQMNQEIIALAKEKNLCLFQTDYTMYIACGLLYKAGMRGINEL